MKDQTLIADLTWTGRRFERDLAVETDDQGRIKRVGPIGPQAPDDAIRLKDHALLPGMIYAHSHAFQRALRHRPERFDTGTGTFWSWRDTMYRLVDELDLDSFYETSKQCFREMLLAGVTSVGEFHYLHHAAKEPWKFDEAILSAARDAGIRICLIQCFYASGGIGRPLEGAQKRFDSISIDEFLRQFERLAGMLDAGTQRLALACHSIRAARIEDIETIDRRAIELDVPFHIHVEEQRREIHECMAAYGVGPLRLMLRQLPIDGHFTAIHCTHSAPDDLRELVSRGGRVCLCPSTEGNLADGLPELREIREAGGKLCIGSDCNLRICMSEDLRWLEFAQRLANERSGIVVDGEGQVAPALFDLATVNGADALKLPAGSIETGKLADLVAIDLNHPSLVGATADSLLHAFVFGCGNGPIKQVWVGGQPLI